MTHNKSFLRKVVRSHLFRWLFSYPLSVRRIWLRGSNQTRSYYGEVIKGGVLVLRPTNIQGDFEVDARSDLAARIIQTGNYEPELTAALECIDHIDGVTLNIGANIGLFAIQIVKRWPTIKQLIAVEPNPDAFGLLKNNVNRNECAGRITCINACVGMSDGTAELATIEGKSEYSSINTIDHPAVVGMRQQGFEVKMLSVASLVQGSKVGLLVIDVEGAELDVLRGGEDVIRRDCPIILCECSDSLLRRFGHSSEELEAWLTRLGYMCNNVSYPERGIFHPFEGELMARPRLGSLSR